MTERERLETALHALKLPVGVLTPIEGHSVRVYPVRLGSVTGDKLNNHLAEVAGRLGVSHLRGSFIAGSSRFGIEVPRHDPSPLPFSAVYPLRSKAHLPIALGHDVYGTLQVIDLAKAPHMLIGGGTGSGKSTAINGFLCGLLRRLSPLLLRVVLIDPKRVELAAFASSPHALHGSISEPEMAVTMLERLGVHMDRRYSLLEELGCRELSSYNRLAKEKQRPLLPRIVVIIDELADLMLTSKGRCEKALVRLAQKARAVGIHLILATQQPKSEVVTSLIKVNVPARLAFSVGNHHESRAILDSAGAEHLLGKGDGLYAARGQGMTRVQSPLVSDEDIQQCLQALKPSASLRDYFRRDARNTEPTEDALLRHFPELLFETPPQPSAPTVPMPQPATTTPPSPGETVINPITPPRNSPLNTPLNNPLSNPDDSVKRAVALAKSRGKLTGIMLSEEGICSRHQSKALMTRLRHLGIIGAHDRRLGYSPLRTTSTTDLSSSIKNPV